MKGRQIHIKCRHTKLKGTQTKSKGRQFHMKGTLNLKVDRLNENGNSFILKGDSFT